MLKQYKQTILAGVLGNAIEWYDFTVYAFFAPIIAKLFFPTQDSYTALLMTFGVFAVGFLIRPLGGIFFGFISDQHSRKKALIISIALMSGGTFLMGLLPTYQMIGIWAPILLTMLRLMQGMAISGELTSATSFLVEHIFTRHRGLVGGLVMSSAALGFIFSAIIATVLSLVLTTHNLQNWGWRLPFLIGGVLGLLGLKLRLQVQESALYQQAQQEKIKVSVATHLLRLNYVLIIRAIGLTCIMAVGSYLYAGYFNTFLIKKGFLMQQALLINTICYCISLILFPIMGILSDKVGRKLVMGSGMALFILLAYPIFWLLNQESLMQVFLGELLFAMCLAPISALIPTVVAELFSTVTRNSGLSIGYNISYALFGGTAPIVALFFAEQTGDPLAPAWYLIACALISLLTLLYVRESYQEALK